MKENNKFDDSGYCEISAAEWFPKLIWLSICNKPVSIERNCIGHKTKQFVKKRLEVKVPLDIDKLEKDKEKSFSFLDKEPPNTGNIEDEPKPHLKQFNPQNVDHAENGKKKKYLKPTPQTKLSKFINFGIVNYEN